MQAIYAFGLLILVAFLGSRFIVKRKNFLSPLTVFFTSGLIYVFIGLYLGKQALNVLSPQVIGDLFPLISFGLGWIGFIVGFQFERRYVSRFSSKYINLSLLLSLFVTGVVFLSLGILLKSLDFSSPSFLLWGMALAFGLLSCLNSPTLLNASAVKIPERGDYFYLARFLASVSGFWGIVGLALLTSFWHFPFFKSQVVMKGSLFFLSSLVFPFVMAYIFHFLTLKKSSEQDLLVYLFGLVFFVSGAAFYFDASPLFGCMVLGITYSNLTKIQEKIYPLLLSTEKPLYIVFLILIGAIWEFDVNIRIALLALGLLGARTVGYSLAFPLFQRILKFPFALPAHFGLNFLSLGGIGVAFAVSVKLAYSMPMADDFVSVALITIIFLELLSPWAMKKSLFRLDSQS